MPQMPMRTLELRSPGKSLERVAESDMVANHFLSVPDHRDISHNSVPQSTRVVHTASLTDL